MSHRSIFGAAAILVGGLFLTASVAAFGQQQPRRPVLVPGGGSTTNPGGGPQQIPIGIGGAQNPGGGPQNPVGVPSLPKPTTVPAVIDVRKEQADALAKTLDVDYRRAFLVEVLADLYKRAGLFAAWPASINKTFTVSLMAKGVTVKEVLQKVAEQGKLKVDYLPEFVVIVQPADPAVLDKLQQQMKDPDRWVRCDAVSDAACLGDKQVAGILVNMLTDGDEGVCEWAEYGLLWHVNLIRFLPAEQKSMLADATIKQLQPLAGEVRQRPNSGMLRDVPGRMMLLAATGAPQARTALAGWAKEAVSHDIRIYAIANLAMSGEADAVRLLIAAYKDQFMADQQKSGNKGWTQPGVYPPIAAGNWMQTAMVSLQRANTAESLAFITEHGVWPLPIRPVFGPVQRWFTAGADGGVLSVTTPLMARQAKQALADAIGKAPAKAEEPMPAMGGFQMWSPFPLKQATWYGMGVCDLFDLLADADNADAVDVVVDAVKDAALLKAAAVAAYTKVEQTQNSQRFMEIDPVLAQPVGRIGATDGAIVEALLAQFAAAADDLSLKLYIVRSLATSHDPRAADLLMNLLSDPDPRLRAAAATALAQTRDPRATDALLACLKTPADKLPWPNWEKEAKDRVRGKPQPIAPLTNPRKQVAAALAATRDPKAIDLMLAAGVDQGLEAEAREAALVFLSDAPITAADIDGFAASAAKLDAAQQRTALAPALNPWAPIVPFRDARCLADGRVVALIAGVAHDPEAFVVQNDVPRDNSAVARLIRPANPRSERALLDLCKDADDHLAYFAARGLQKYGDPQIEVKLEK